MVDHVSNPSSTEAKEGLSQIQDKSVLHSKFQARTDYTETVSQNQTNKSLAVYEIKTCKQIFYTDFSYFIIDII